MEIAIIGLFLIVVLVLFAVRIGVTKEKTEKDEPRPVIHTSGIYSVVRRDPREAAYAIKPPEDEIRKYLDDQNVDTEGAPLSAADKKSLVEAFFADLETNVSEIEQGDEAEVSFYYYDFVRKDAVCGEYVTKGEFVTREDLFVHPELIPPFHLGCSCRLRGHHGDDKLQETTALKLRPLLVEDSAEPQLPSWTSILKLP